MRFSCFNCGSVYSERVDYCTVCMIDKCIIHLPESGQKVFLDRNREGVKKVGELRTLSEGRIIEGYEALGRLPNVWKMLVYGIPGGGKSTLALKFASSWKYTVLYCSVEEKFSDSMRQKIVIWEIAGNIYFSDAQNSREIRMDISEVKPSLLVIDSVTMLDAGELDINLPLAQIWICHSTKQGEYRGDSSLGHIVDMIVRVESGLGYIEKNRFSAIGKPLEIF